MSPPRLPCDRFPYGLVSPMNAYARGLRRMLAPPPLTSEFVGMAVYAPASFHDVMDDDVESDGSSIGDVVAPSRPLSRECAMANAPGQPPVVAESLQTHTPPDPYAEALARAQGHGEELRRRRQSHPPPALARSAQHATPRARNPASGAQGHARQHLFFSSIFGALCERGRKLEGSITFSTSWREGCCS